MGQKSNIWRSFKGFSLRGLNKSKEVCTCLFLILAQSSTFQSRFLHSKQSTTRRLDLSAKEKYVLSKSMLGAVNLHRDNNTLTQILLVIRTLILAFVKVRLKFLSEIVKFS